MPLAILWHTSILQDWQCNWTSRAITQNTKIWWSTICRFRNKKGTEAEMHPAVVFVIITAVALGSYWSMFFLFLETRSHSNSPVPFSFVKWWELVTPRCSNYGPVSRETGGCFPEAVTYAGLKNVPSGCLGHAVFLVEQVKFLTSLVQSAMVGSGKSCSIIIIS